MMNCAPVLFLIFNRPNHTQQVFNRIRDQKPSRLYVAADGPRPDKPDDWAECKKTRAILEEIDWDCEVKTLLRDHNLGCGQAISGALAWFFQNENEGIILEDDCLPSFSFFQYCTELLEKYRQDTRVMQIGGVNLLNSPDQSMTSSYFFSNQNCIWGWATWKRSWEMYDYNMQHYEEVLAADYFRNYFNSATEYEYYKSIFDTAYHDNIAFDSWDYQWDFSRLINSGLVILPHNNLVVNTGIGQSDSTHNTSPNSVGRGLIANEVTFPLIHPDFMMTNRAFDKKVFDENFTSPTRRIKSYVKKALPKPLLDHFLIPLYKKVRMSN